MADFKRDAKELLDAIGGKDNVNAVTHCATRMRFVLDDPSKADTERIEDIEAVKGTFTQAGQFQVIVGNRVADFYNEFSAISGLEGVSKDDVKSAGKKNMNSLQRIMAALAEIFTPLIPAIIIGGLILGFRNVLEQVQFAALGQAMVDGQAAFTTAGEPIYNTIVNVSPFWSGVNAFLWLPGEAIFHFLPVGITWSVTRKMGTTQILGIVLGITLVSPQLMNAYGVTDILAGDVNQWDFGFFQLDMIGYQAQVIPAMLAGFLLVYLEKWLRRVIPEAISMIFVPLFALIPTVFIAHAVIGPIGWQLGIWLSQVVQWGLTGTFNWVFGFIFGGLYAPLVITGLHHMTNAIDLQLVADFDQTILWPMIALSNIAQGSAVLGIIWMHRGNEKEQQISIPAMISAYLGVTEPALFGINIKFVYPFVAGMIGSAFAGMTSVALNVASFNIGVGGLPGILSIIPEYWIGFLIAMTIAIVVPFVLVMVFEKRGIMTKWENDHLPIPKLGN
ncbi:PTS system trehalose-specific IIB component, Glc family (TC 4.A.1.2.4)/PTS system trehalose-specific IIC component, Glc family (TC 4.A.1.2.4) [Alkalibacterium subtropicum]|uniref:PTS system trehalose-specific IIB component, Glc family (TC 4.A.1.2.4)/PTS system trehalose-specific IIC component, Glc family (TC 4.A.1.2.4) n=1 Tax=Alkalibacterium subtropicum TaxID=753702 RepID=A0A1I1LPI9_9LACT|nr:PTS system trehalose-specific EIIBC component [Alkalibacterium subtropicum]SFC74991.1 PTS system trehalose-specific IIB component, Glc family (TC 4.A.1.2.4)/PTS system trehalose-specific IIC component, Glc family (TC 4.A.1.2.4) [Alkalibacterium subtropicum]